jgi:large subunit ribosomal protein L13
MAKEEIIIDADNAILGRLASYAAKQALLGKEVMILNCENVVITGNRKSILNEYLAKKRKTSARNSANPEKIVKRTIRGMLPYKMGRGADAFARIKCYMGVPKEFEEKKKVKSATKKQGLMEINQLVKMLR